MTYDEYVTAVERESAAVIDALRRGPLDAAVPSCPEWTLADLATHLGSFAVWTHVLCEGTGRPKPPFPDRPDDNRAVAWLEELLGHLTSELRATAEDTQVWTWVSSDKSARFVARRAANELAIHRYDAQLAIGAPEPIAPALAADGIEETFLMRNDSEQPEPHAGEGETIHLHGAEGDEWMITLGRERIDWSRAHGKADLALRGAVSDLELLLYQRPTIGSVERIGDESVLDVWRREFSF